LLQGSSSNFILVPQKPKKIHYKNKKNPAL